MTVVTETLDLANGSTPRGARVYFRLAGTNGAPVEGEVGSVSIVGDLPVPVLANGSYSVTLYGNDVITPSGTRWKRFVVLASGPNPAPVYVNVPSTGGPYAVDAILDEAPASVASSALTTEIANRVAGDATNANAVTTEATARTTADSILAAAITAETTRATSAEATKQAAGTSLQIASDLADLHSAATARTNLGLGTAATHAHTDYDAAGAAAAAQAASQPLDSDLSAIALLSTTAFGRALLEASNAAAARNAIGAGASVAVDAVADGGCVGDTIVLTDAMMAAGSNTLTSASAAFTAADYGKKVAVAGVGTGGAALTSSNNTITAYIDAHTVTIQKSAVVASVAARSVADGVTTINSQTITSATAAFTAGDYGKTITIPNAGERDRRILTEQASMAVGFPTLTAAYACFTAGMVNQKVKVAGAGASSAPLVATISAYISPTQVTLDTNASVTVAGALVQVWTVADLVTRISSYVNATTVTIQRWASAALTGATFQIGGHEAVYATDDLTTLNTWLATLPAHATVTIPKGHLIFLGQGVLACAQPVTFRGADQLSSGFHIGASSGRLSAGSNDVTFDNVLFQAIHNGSTDLFASRTATNYTGWRFTDCVWDGVRAIFGKIGAVQDDGTTLTSASGHDGPLWIDRPKVYGNLGDGMHFDAVNGFEIDTPYLRDCGTTAGGSGGWALKFSNGSHGKVMGGLIEWCGKDGVDTYDSEGVDVIGLEVRHCVNIGISAKWISNQQYRGNGRQRYVGCRVWNCGAGAQMNVHRGDELGLHVYGCVSYGVRLAVASDTNLAADPSVYSILGHIVAVGNNLGVQIGSLGSVNRAIAASIQAHNNATYGIILDCAETILSNYQAFNNGLGGCQLTPTATKNQLWGGHTQDANGMATVNAGATLNLFNGYGEEAAGSGNSPTLATWPAGALVKNTDDSTSWRRTASGWENATPLGAASSVIINPVHVVIPASVYPSATSGHAFDTVARIASAFNSTVRFQSSTPASGDSVSWDVVLQAGTWRLDILEATESDAAIYQASVDGANVGGTSDLYNASASFRARSGITGIVVPTLKLIRVTFTVTSKNASSSGFYLTLSGFSMTKTA